MNIIIQNILKIIFLVGLNDDEEHLEINGVRVDFYPINKEKSGSMREWLDRNYDYDKYSEEQNSEGECL